MPKNKYNFGRKQEERVESSLRARGAKVSLSSGSKGAADLTAQFPTGKIWKVQVKASSGNMPSSPSPKDLGRLKQSSTKSKATPVIAKVTPKGIEYTSARSGKRLKP